MQKFQADIINCRMSENYYWFLRFDYGVGTFIIQKKSYASQCRDQADIMQIIFVLHEKS
jgi:hypothetical protein